MFGNPKRSTPTGGFRNVDIRSNVLKSAIGGLLTGLLTLWRKGQGAGSKGGISRTDHQSK